MGAEYQERRIRGTETQSEVIVYMNDQHALALHEDGSSYSGNLGSAPTGVRFMSGKEFDNMTVDEASEWLLDNHEKWSHPWAILAHDISHTPKSAKVNALCKKIDAITEKILAISPSLQFYTTTEVDEGTSKSIRDTITRGHLSKVVEPRIAARKSKTIKCNHCGSILNKTYVRHSCNVCQSQDAFTTTGDFNSITNKADKVLTLLTERAKLATEMNKKLKSDAEKHGAKTWVIGCWCSS